MASVGQDEAMNALLESAKHSDLTVTCNGHDFHIHRAIVCPRSTFFDAACRGRFKESHSNRIELQDDDPATIKRMITYLYTFSYKDEEDLNPESDFRDSTSPEEVGDVAIGEDESKSDHNMGRPALVSSVRLYAVADKYGIPSLKELAKERFCNWAEINWANESLPDMIREIFQSTPNSDRGLRDVVVRIVATHASNLIQKDGFRDLLGELGDLGLDVFCQTLNTHSEEVSDLRSRISKLEAETELLRGELNHQEQHSSQQASNMSLIIKKINSLVECQRCKKGFNAEVEERGWGGPTLRCKECQTRQYLN